MIFTGCGVAITTSFTPKGTICFDAMAKHIEYLIDNKTDAIIVCGTTGESATLSLDEKILLSQFVVDRVAGRIPVIAGSGGNCTATAIQTTKALAKTGVSGFMVVTPYYNKATQAGLVQHFTQIAGCTDLPVILYNVPSRTHVNLLPATVAVLAEVPNIVGIKEASGDISQISEVFAQCPKDFAVYCGNDDQVLPMVALGAVGAISVVANLVPDKIHDIVTHYATDPAKSVEIQLNLLTLIQAMFIEINPIPVKYAMVQLTLGTPYLRMPLTPLSEKNKPQVDAVLEKYDLL